jgi:hypothetical protein
VRVGYVRQGNENPEEGIAQIFAKISTRGGGGVNGFLIKIQAG